jgi:hypothetical protein
MLRCRPPEHATGRQPPGRVALDHAKAIAVRLLTPSSVARPLAGAGAGREAPAGREASRRTDNTPTTMNTAGVGECISVGASQIGAASERFVSAMEPLQGGRPVCVGVRCTVSV